MPDRHLDDQGRVILDPEPDYHDERAIIACGMCDDEGYRGGTVCDHIDHVSTTERGRGLMRAELDRIRQRKAQRARGASA